jgi:spore germination protein YaaH
MILWGEIGIYKKEGDYKVIGFLPTWMIGKTKTYTTELDQLVFLGIEADENGDLVWELQSKKINNETYIEMKNNIRKSGGKNIVGIKQFDDEKLHKLLANESARRNLIEQIKAVVVTGNFDGVNVDFEFMNDPNAVMKDENYQFMKELKEAEVGEISLDVFANTVIKGDVGKLNRMLGVIDNLIVMLMIFIGRGAVMWVRWLR